MVGLAVHRSWRVGGGHGGSSKSGYLQHVSPEKHQQLQRDDSIPPPPPPPPGPPPKSSSGRGRRSYRNDGRENRVQRQLAPRTSQAAQQQQSSRPPPQQTAPAQRHHHQHRTAQQQRPADVPRIVTPLAPRSHNHPPNVRPQEYRSSAMTTNMIDIVPSSPSKNKNKHNLASPPPPGEDPSISSSRPPSHRRDHDRQQQQQHVRGNDGGGSTIDGDSSHANNSAMGGDRDADPDDPDQHYNDDFSSFANSSVGYSQSGTFDEGLSRPGTVVTYGGDETYALSPAGALSPGGGGAHGRGGGDENARRSRGGSNGGGGAGGGWVAFPDDDDDTFAGGGRENESSFLSISSSRDGASALTDHMSAILPEGSCIGGEDHKTQSPSVEHPESVEVYASGLHRSSPSSSRPGAGGGRRSTAPVPGRTSRLPRIASDGTPADLLRTPFLLEEAAEASGIGIVSPSSTAASPTRSRGSNGAEESSEEADSWAPDRTPNDDGGANPASGWKSPTITVQTEGTTQVPTTPGASASALRSSSFDAAAVKALQSPHRTRGNSQISAAAPKSKNNKQQRKEEDLSPRTLRRKRRSERSKLAAKAERDHWKSVLTSRVVSCGPDSLATADALGHLGNVHIKCGEYDEAYGRYKSTVKMLRRRGAERAEVAWRKGTISGSLVEDDSGSGGVSCAEDDLRLARALDRAGLAASLCHKNRSSGGGGKDGAASAQQSHFPKGHPKGPKDELLRHAGSSDTDSSAGGISQSSSEDRADRDLLDYAKSSLLEAFSLRHRRLGPRHVDTVETLNSLAAVYLRLSLLPESKGAYSEVLAVRRAVFGRGHPSVAVAAHALGGVLMRMGEWEGAVEHMEYALRVCTGKRMGLGEGHPMVRKIGKEMRTLERIMVGAGYR